MSKPIKLFRVTCRGMHNSLGSGQTHGIGYVVAENPQRAYECMRKSLDDRKLGFHSERELLTIELIADASEYPACGVTLYLDA